MLRESQVNVPPLNPTSAELPSVDHVKDHVGVDGGLHAVGEISAPESPETIDKSLIRGIAWLGSVKWIVQAVTWGTTILVARILTPSDYGLLSMATVILTFIALISESGIGTTIVQKRAISPEQTAQINGAAVLLGAVCCIAACLLAVPVGWFYNEPRLPAVIVAASFVLLIAAFRIVPGALLQREMRFPRLAVIDAVAGLAQAFATLGLAELGFRYWSLLIGGVIGALIGTGATLASRSHKMSFPNWETLKPILPFTHQVLIGRLCWYAYQDSDFIVAGKRLGSQALGGYSYAWTLASMPVDKISALVGGVTSPVFSAVQNDNAALRRYFLALTEGLAIVAFPMTVGLALVAGELIPVVLGPTWTFMVTPLRVLAAYASIRTIAPLPAHLLTAIADTRFQMYLSGLAAVVLPTAFYIGSHWGTLGIAVAWTIAHPVMVYLPGVTRVSRKIQMSPAAYLKALWPAVSSCLVMAAAVMFVRAKTPVTTLPVRLAAEVLAGAILYASCIGLFHRARITSFIAVIKGARA
jgi:O-antigen/teichoic acid export membrane protein